MRLNEIGRKRRKSTLIQQKVVDVLRRVDIIELLRDDLCSGDNRNRFLIDNDIYKIACEKWGDDFAPFVTEGIYSFVGPCWRNQSSNLFGMAVVDTALGNGYEQIEDKWLIFSTILNLASMTGFLRDVSWERIEQAKKIACKMHGVTVPCFGWYRNFPAKDQWRDYYNYVVKPMMESITESGAHGKLFECLDDWRYVANQLEVPVHLDEDVVKFLVEDAIGYILAGDTSHYNPYWIFGSKCYEEIFKDIQGIEKEEEAKLNEADETLEFEFEMEDE